MQNSIPVVVLAFANNREDPSQSLNALDAERSVLQRILERYQEKGWGRYYTAASSVPSELKKDLSRYSGNLLIFHYAGHANGRELQLEGRDGNAVSFSGESLLAFLKEEIELKLVFLNACATRNHVERLFSIGVPAVIATSSTVDDAEAKDFAQAFYTDLVNGKSLGTAFDGAKSVVKPSDTKSRIYRKIDWESADSYDSFPWKLCIQDESILAWTLKDTRPNLDQNSTLPQELNSIPGLYTDFVGRTKELSELKKLLNEGKPVQLVNGLPGIGKTSLAKSYINLNRDTYDHFLWVSVLIDSKNFATYTNASQAIANQKEVFDLLKLNFDLDESEASRTKRLLFALKGIGGRNLMVIDNATKHISDIQALLPPGENWQLLITSRQELPPFISYKLYALNPTEGEKLFYSLYPNGKLVQKQVKDLLKLVGYHPLTIELFARLCNVSPLTINPAEIIKKLEDKSLYTLSKKVWAGRSDREVEVFSYLLGVFELAELSNAEKGLLIQWAVLPSKDIPFDILPTLFSIRPNELEVFESTLMSLCQQGWVNFNQDKMTFRIHEMVQEFARYQIPPTKINCQKVIQGVLQFLHFDPSQGRMNPMLCMPYLPHGESILRHLGKRSKSLSMLHNQLGLIYLNLGQYQKAISFLEPALIWPTEQKILSVVALIKNNIGGCYDKLGSYELAVKYYLEALTLDEKTLELDSREVIMDKKNLAAAYENWGKKDLAFKYYTEAYEAIDSDDDPLMPLILNSLGHFYLNLEKPQSSVAEGYLIRALKLSKEGLLRSTIQNNLGSAYIQLGEVNNALYYHKLSYDYDSKTLQKDHPSIGIGQLNIGSLLFQIGKIDEAYTLLKKSFAILSDKLGLDHQTTQKAIFWLNQIEKKLNREGEK